MHQEKEQNRAGIKNIFLKVIVAAVCDRLHALTALDNRLL